MQTITFRSTIIADGKEEKQMRKGDFIWGIALAGVLAFLVVPATNKIFVSATTQHPYPMAFIKYFILASMGELLGRRLTSGDWSKPTGFGARMVVWGFIGMVIMVVFAILADGVVSLQHRGILPDTNSRLLTAFLTSLFSNAIFGPVFMTFHRFSDTYIDVRFSTGKSPSVKELTRMIDWDNIVSFVILKTLVFWWIPANTLIFYMPGEYRIITAAMMSICLGVILTIAKRLRTKDENLAMAA